MKQAIQHADSLLVISVECVIITMKEEYKMEKFVVLENDDGIIPASKKGECIYCGSKIGEYHKSDCVTITKKVKVRYSFEIEIEVPRSWDKEQIEYARNNGRWCADNSLLEMQLYADENNTCLCPFFKCEVLESLPDDGDL